MAFCGKCGQQVNEGVRFCPACGSPMQIVAAEPNRQQTPPPVQPTDAESMAKATATADALSDKLSGMNKTADLTDQFDKADVEQNKVMAILAYFGILVLIPILAAKDSKFARFHANQGLLLCIAMFGWIIADSVLTALLLAILWRGLGLWSIYSLCGTVLNLVYIVFTVLAVIGIINALNGRAKELPIIGKYRLLK